MAYIIVPCCIYLRNDTFLKIKTLRYKCFWQCFGRSQDRIFMHVKFSCLNCSNQIVAEFDHDIIHILEITHQSTTLDCCWIQKQLRYDSKSCNLAPLDKIALLYQIPGKNCKFGSSEHTQNEVNNMNSTKYLCHISQHQRKKVITEKRLNYPNT